MIKLENKILEYHEFLNGIYSDAEKLLEKLTNLGYNATLNSYNDHYINIDGSYVNQKYYMPVITIANKGDICFNLTGIEFEFYITKERLINTDALDEFLNQYQNELNIYEYQNCTIDVYKTGNSKTELLNNIIKSNDEKFGISIDCSKYDFDEMLKHFDNICFLLEL